MRTQLPSICAGLLLAFALTPARVSAQDVPVQPVLKALRTHGLSVVAIVLGTSRTPR